jgi:hypothetical protein
VLEKSIEVRVYLGAILLAQQIQFFLIESVDGGYLDAINLARSASVRAANISATYDPDMDYA